MIKGESVSLAQVFSIPKQYPLFTDWVKEYATKAMTGSLPFQCRFCESVHENETSQENHLRENPLCNQKAVQEFKKLTALYM